jgi:hypothetical protein
MGAAVKDEFFFSFDFNTLGQVHPAFEHLSRHFRAGTLRFFFILLGTTIF